MSLFSALTVAVGGLSAQSSAIGNISDNLANTQTTGFKGVDTQFESLVTQSNLFANDPGGVRASPHYMNDIQGNLTQSQSATSLAITGQGFFPVRPAVVGASGTTTFGGTSLFTRAGDFTLNKSGYLVNGAGYYLTGYEVNTSGDVDTSASMPIQLAALLDNPVGTTAVGYSANLPASAAVNFTSPPSTIQVYDTLGTQHNMTFVWEKTDTNNWRVKVTVPEGKQTVFAGTPPITISSDYVTTIPFVFNNATTSTVQAGTIETITPDTGVAAAATIGIADGVTLTCSNTGVVGNTMSLTIGPVKAGNLYDVTVHVTGQPDAVYADVDGTTNAGFWTALIADINTGDGTTDASPFITAAALGTGAGAIVSGTYNLIGGHEAPTYSIVDNSAQAENEAQVTFTLDFPGAGAQEITATFGNYDISKGLTQFADTAVSVSSFDQNGIPRGSFQNLSIDKNGFVALNYDNGRTRTIAQIPVVQFFAQDQLQRLTGGAFQQTLASGTARYSAPGTNGAGTIVGNALEGSNVDIATEFTKLITAQRVYSANAKTVTTADSMLQEVINIIR